MEGKLKCSLLSWTEAVAMSRKVAEKIRAAKFRPDYIIGITRGGWIPAVLLSDELGINNLLSVKTEHWGITATRDKKAHLTVPLSSDLSNKKILLVDDLTDSGESLQLARRHLKEKNAEEIKTATLIHKSQSQFCPDFYAKRTEQWIWVIMPWNRNEDLNNLIKKLPGGLDPGEIREKLRKDFAIDVTRELVTHTLKNAY